MFLFVFLLPSLLCSSSIAPGQQPSNISLLPSFAWANHPLAQAVNGHTASLEERQRRHSNKAIIITAEIVLHVLWHDRRAQLEIATLEAGQQAVPSHASIVCTDHVGGFVDENAPSKAGIVATVGALCGSVRSGAEQVGAADEIVEDGLDLNFILAPLQATHSV